MEAEAVEALSPLDGRYRDQVAPLRAYFSEAALIRARIQVELLWLARLAATPPLAASLKDVAVDSLRRLARDVPNDAVARVKSIEAQTRHDVKAVEYYLRELIEAQGWAPSIHAWLHFACTSEDINNCAYGLMLRAADDHVHGALRSVEERLRRLAADWAAVPMLSRTHGQSASPTTVGKELAVFAYRLARARRVLAMTPVLAKFNGAVGNYNAHVVACPEVDWLALSKSFVEDDLGLEWNPVTTQIESHDGLAQRMDALRRHAAIQIDLCRDVWGYIALGYFVQAAQAGEVGSSTMPHKVNPIDFENAEGNLGIAMALAGHLADKLAVSRWQRDLSDSTVQRNLGTVFGHLVLAAQMISRGLDKLELGRDAVAQDLERAPEVLAEAVQTVMRRYGVADAYERLKEATRGRASVDRAVLDACLDACPGVPEEAKERLACLTPSAYTGLAAQVTHLALRLTAEE